MILLVLSSSFSDSSKVFSRLSFPMTRAAAAICLNSSPSLRKHRIREPASKANATDQYIKRSMLNSSLPLGLPSNTSHILHNSAKLAPLHHLKTASLNSGLNELTYSSGTMGNRDSTETWAMA